MVDNETAKGDSPSCNCCMRSCAADCDALEKKSSSSISTDRESSVVDRDDVWEYRNKFDGSNMVAFGIVNETADRIFSEKRTATNRSSMCNLPSILIDDESFFLFDSIIYYSVLLDIRL